MATVRRWGWIASGLYAHLFHISSIRASATISHDPGCWWWRGRTASGLYANLFHISSIGARAAVSHDPGGMRWRRRWLSWPHIHFNVEVPFHIRIRLVPFAHRMMIRWWRLRMVVRVRRLLLWVPM